MDRIVVDSGVNPLRDGYSVSSRALIITPRGRGMISFPEDVDFKLQADVKCHECDGDEDWQLDFVVPC